MYLYEYSLLIFDKGARQYNGEKVISSTNGAGTIRIHKQKKPNKQKESSQPLQHFHKN